MSELRCSVIIPVRDMAAFVGEAIESALAQRRAAAEIVVVDDGSSDASAETAERYASRGVRLVRQAPAGLSAARNRGIAESSGELIAFLDADDRWRPDALSRLAAALEEDDGAVLAYGESATMSPAGEVYGTEGGPIFAPRPSGDVLESLLAGNFIPGAGAALVRREAGLEGEFFRVDLPRSNDWEAWCRLALVGRFRYVGPPPLLERRAHEASISSTLGAGVEAALPAVDAVFSAPALRHRFSPSRLRRLRARRISHLHATAGTKCLQQRRWREARRHFASSLRGRPLRPREQLLLALSMLHVLPPVVERRLR
jgi:glycosyltransferase involved in cell wall biosynthesis